MSSQLQIVHPGERRLVALADALLRVAMLPARLWPARRPAAPPRRILLLRLERIGDLVMALGAIRAVRERAPQAEVHLVVGSWNEALARLVPGLDRVETLDAPWLARGSRADSLLAMTRRALEWRRRRYDLAINFEGDIRSNLLLGLSGASRRVGFAMAGGGPVLTDRVPFDGRAHTAVNALRLVEHAFGVTAAPVVPAPGGDAAALDAASVAPGFSRALDLPAAARERAAALLGAVPAGGVLIGVHASGGREIKQWDPQRFAAVATWAARTYGATIVLTGSAGDREIVDQVRTGLSGDVPVVDLTGELDVVTLAAVLERLALLVTGDTGPMHLAALVGTPIVAIFGPSEPARYAPIGSAFKIVRIDLPCAPCNQIRRPPERCVGHIPDCLVGVDVPAVCAAVEELIGSAVVVRL